MNMDNPFIDKVNSILGSIVAVLSYFLGEHWVLFAAFLLLNIVDYVTGCMKSKINGKINSQKGAIGALKKVGYWIMILVAFGMSVVFQEIGEVININLKITVLIGWFVLATLIINELRSILENFVEAGFNVPKYLIKGLEVANKALDGTIKLESGEVELTKDVSDKTQVTLSIDKSTKK